MTAAGSCLKALSSAERCAAEDIRSSTDRRVVLSRLLENMLVAVRETSLRTQLRIPGSQLGPASGSDHLHACLRALALLPGQQRA